MKTLSTKEKDKQEAIEELRRHIKVGYNDGSALSIA